MDLFQEYGQRGNTRGMHVWKEGGRDGGTVSRIRAMVSLRIHVQY